MKCSLNEVKPLTPRRTLPNYKEYLRTEKAQGVSSTLRLKMNKYPRRHFKPTKRHIHILGKRNNQRKSECHRGMFSRRRHQVPGLEAQSCGWKLAPGGPAPLRSIYKGGSGGPACPPQPRTVTSWQVISRQHGWSCSILHANPCLQESCVCELALNLAFN